MSEQYPDHEQPTERRPAIPRRAASERIPQGLLKPDQAPTRRTRRPPQTGEAQIHPQQPVLPRDSALYVPWWGFVLVILAVAGITCGMWWMVLSNRGVGATNLGPTPTPIFVVITATPTLGLSPADLEATANANPTSSLATPAQIETPTATVPPTPVVPIQIGSQVAITGTEGFGLRIRQGPGLGYDLVFLGIDGELLLVEDGPREADGYVWWYVVDPDDENRFGWAVQDYLVVIQP